MANQYPLPNVKKPQVEGRAGKNAGLGEKIENALTRFLQKVVLWSLDFIGDLLVDTFDNAMNIMQPGMTRMTQPLFDEIKKQKGVPQAMLDTIAAIENEKGEATFLGRLFGFIGLLVPMVTGGLAPLGRSTGYVLDYNMRTGRPAPAETVDLFKRGLLTEDQTNGTLGELGVTLPHIAAIMELYDDNANPDDLVFGFLRGLYGESELFERMKKAGIPKGLWDVYREQANVYPPIQDILRMLVKEAFNEEAKSKYGLADEYPEEATEHAAKQGLSEDWVRAYWAAHWQLPSPNQVFEMLHRGVIGEQELNDYLKFADYPSYWREKMKQISYTLLTRVDIRRAYQVGKLTEDEVREQYKKRGYDETDADTLTAIAVSGASSREKDLTKSDTIGLYKDGLQSRGEAKSDLVKMGYDEDEAEDLLKRADFDMKKKEKTDAINYVEERYKLGSIGKNEAMTELSLINLSQIAVDRYILEWDRQLEASVALPTNSELTRFFIADTITEDEFRSVLNRRNYDPQYVEWFVKEALAKKSAAQEVDNA